VPCHERFVAWGRRENQVNVSRSPGPLSNVRVLEIAQYVAGPMAAMALADLGADVVKVEPLPKGDAFRTYGIRRGGFAAFWINVNRGKRSVALDLKDPADAHRCRELVQRADIVLLTSRPGALDSVGFDDASLEALNSSLIRVHVTGFGPNGPRAGQPVFDNLVQGLSGLAAFQGGGNAPEVLAPMVVDKVAALTIANAALAALYNRSVSGRGARVDVSLLDAAAYWNFPDVFQDRTFVSDDRRTGRLRSPIAATRDGQIILSPVSGRQISRTADALGHPEWVAHLKQFDSHIDLMEEMMRLVETVTRSMTTDEVLDRFAEFDVPAGPVLGLDEHFADPQVVHNELYEIVDDPSLGEVRVVRSPALFDGQPQRAPFHVAALGADAATVARDWRVPSLEEKK
jgi:crotonobetainyl-CoA:carnitine CoA-transferase CaiB-like acyl-CoA transferase